MPSFPLHFAPSDSGQPEPWGPWSYSHCQCQSKLPRRAILVVDLQWHDCHGCHCYYWPPLPLLPWPPPPLLPWLPPLPDACCWLLKSSISCLCLCSSSWAFSNDQDIIVRKRGKRWTKLLFPGGGEYEGPRCCLLPFPLFPGNFFLWRWIGAEGRGIAIARWIINGCIDWSVDWEWKLVLGVMSVQKEKKTCQWRRGATLLYSASPRSDHSLWNARPTVSQPVWETKIVMIESKDHRGWPILPWPWSTEDDSFRPHVAAHDVTARESLFLVPQHTPGMESCRKGCRAVLWSAAEMATMNSISTNCYLNQSQLTYLKIATLTFPLRHSSPTNITRSELNLVENQLEFKSYK